MLFRSAAAFWLGMLWRRANRKAAWASIVLTFLLFFLLPAAIPTLSPGLKTHPRLAAMTNPAPIEHVYTARQLEVEQRQEEIRQWDALNAQGKALDARPADIEVGQRFSKVFRLPQRSIFWQRGVRRNADGRLEGQGMFNLELLLLDAMGMDLSGHSYAMNETIRVLFRTILPFLILLAVGLLTRPDDAAMLNRFFIKMKTPVQPDPDADRRALERSFADPASCTARKLFPASSWEFEKWNSEDGWGFFLSVLAAIGIVGLLFFLVSLGSGP